MKAPFASFGARTMTAASVVLAQAVLAACAQHRSLAPAQGETVVSLGTLLEEMAAEDLPRPDSFVGIRINDRGEGVDVNRRGTESPAQLADTEIHVVLCGGDHETRRRAVTEYADRVGLRAWQVIRGVSCPEVMLEFNGDSTTRTSTLRDVFTEAFGVDGSAPVRSWTGAFRIDRPEPDRPRRAPPAHAPVAPPEGWTEAIAAKQKENRACRAPGC